MERKKQLLRQAGKNGQATRYGTSPKHRDQGPPVLHSTVIWCSAGPRSVKRQNHLIKEEMKFRGGSRKKTLAPVAASLAEEFLSLIICFLGDSEHKVLS